MHLIASALFTVVCSCIFLTEAAHAACKQVNLQEQTDCLIGEAMQRKDSRTVVRLLRLPWADTARLMLAGPCITINYFRCAIGGGALDALPAIAAAGGDPNITTRDSVFLNLRALPKNG
jgi:hypothetical protein